MRMFTMGTTRMMMILCGLPWQGLLAEGIFLLLATTIPVMISVTIWRACPFCPQSSWVQSRGSTQSTSRGPSSAPCMHVMHVSVSLNIIIQHLGYHILVNPAVCHIYFSGPAQHPISNPHAVILKLRQYVDGKPSLPEGTA